MAEKDMEVSKVVSWVKRGKSGTFIDKKTGEEKTWQIWTFKVKDDERYFTWFEKDNVPNPVVGMNIKAMEFESEANYGTDGKKYDNHTVKWFKLEGDAPEPQKSTQKPPGRPGGTIYDSNLSFYIAYAKDLMVAAMGANEDYGLRAVDALADEVVDIGMDMYQKACGTKPTPNTDSIRIPKLNPEDDYPETFSDGVPIGEPPEWVK